MGIVYPSGQHITPAVTQFVSGAPIEEKMVVDTYSDLVDPSTWGNIAFGCYWDISIYLGMIVSVVNDTSENNGLWILKTMPKESDYLKVSDGDMLSIDGWEKVGGEKVEVDDVTIKFDPTQDSSSSDPGAYHDDDNKIWVNQVNGGKW